MKKLFLLIMLILFVSSYSEVIDKIVARVNDQVITDFDIRLLLFMQRNKMSYDSVLKQLLDENLIIASAKDMDYKIQDEQVNYNVDQTIANQRAKYGSDKLFLDALKNEGLMLSSLKENYRKQIKNSMLKEQILDDKVKKRISITTDEVSKYYDNNKSEFVKEPMTFAIRTAYVSAIDTNKMKSIYKNITKGKKPPKNVISKKFKKLYKNLLNENFQKLLNKNKKYSDYIINKKGLNFYKILRWDNEYPSVIFYTIPLSATKTSFKNAGKKTRNYIEQIKQGAEFEQIKTKADEDYDQLFTDGKYPITAIAKDYIDKFTDAKKNQVFDLKTNNGLYIIKVVDITNIEYSQLGKIYDDIYKKIYEIKYKKLYSELIEDAKKENYIKVFK
ncbi:hypothetical protein J7L48_10570 [bacterium]|nr:hypothetical protein [bacterium]